MFNQIKTLSKEMKLIIACVVIGLSASSGFINRFLLMVMLTFHEDYTYYRFIKCSLCISSILFIIGSGYAIRLLYKQRDNKKPGLLRLFLLIGISFVISSVIIGGFYRQIGIL